MCCQYNWNVFFSTVLGLLQESDDLVSKFPSWIKKIMLEGPVVQLFCMCKLDMRFGSMLFTYFCYHFIYLMGVVLSEFQNDFVWAVESVKIWQMHCVSVHFETWNSNYCLILAIYVHFFCRIWCLADEQLGII
jgi:hypothetical protein